MKMFFIGLLLCKRKGRGFLGVRVLYCGQKYVPLLTNDLC